MAQFPLQYTAPTVMPVKMSTRLVQSVTLSGHGDISRIKVEHTPVELTPADDHIAVQVHYCGLNFTDNYLRLGIIRNEKFPVIMGSECSGFVLAVGRNVKDLKVGYRVLCLKMQGGLFSQIINVPRKNCFRVPDDVSLMNAVGLGLSFVVAHLCLFEIGHLRQGQSVFMQSIAGGVGTAVVQLAKTVRDVDVFGTASELKHDNLLSLGMRRVYTTDEDYVTRMLKYFPGGAQLIINTNGGTDFEKCCNLITHSATLINIGSNSTAWYPRSTSFGFVKPTWDSGIFYTTGLINRHSSVAGLNVGAWLEHRPERVKAILAKLFEFYKRGQIEPIIHSVLPFNQVTDGIKMLCERKNYGKIILDLGQHIYTVPSLPDLMVSERQPPKSVDPAEENDADSEDS